MEDVILCKTKMASTPFVMKNTKLHLYSLEELAFYIMENVDLLESEFMDADLEIWIEQKLKVADLANRLKVCRNTNQHLTRYIQLILDSTNYCMEEEKQEVLSLLQRYEKCTISEGKKSRADHLIKKQRYSASVRLYQEILFQSHEYLSPKFIGEVYHNLGSAFCGLFHFHLGAWCFEQASMNYPLDLSKECQVKAQSLANAVENSTPFFLLPDMDKYKKEIDEQLEDKYPLTFETRLVQWKQEFK